MNKVVYDNKKFVPDRNILAYRNGDYFIYFEYKINPIRNKDSRLLCK